MPGSSSAKTRFALLPGHDECRHLDSLDTHSHPRGAMHDVSTSRPCERRDPSVSAIALIAALRTLVSALEQRPFFTFEARGDGSLRSQGRPAERERDAM